MNKNRCNYLAGDVCSSLEEKDERITELEQVIKIIIRKSHYAEDVDALKGLEAIHDLATEVMVGDKVTEGD